MGGRPEPEAIVRAIITLAHRLNIAVVAEGIETDAHRERLRALGCDFGQGYRFAPARSAEETEALLARDPRW